MKTYTVEVRQTVKVTIDETKFTEEFMAEFRGYMYPFRTVERHVEHLAQLHARGITNDFGENFIEGYGPAKQMGIDMNVDDVEAEVQP